MPSFKNVAFGLLGAAAAAAATSDVHDLKKDTFDTFVRENDLVLAEFFAPWCGHCKALAPEYEEAATTLKEKNILLAKVDCTEETDLCSNFGVEGYPTLKVFRGPDNIKPYSGQRKAEAIVSYMTKQSLPAVSVVDKNSIDDFKTADKVVVIAYIDAKDQSSNKTFTSVANNLRDNFIFGATSDAALAKAAGVKQPAIVLYKSFDEGESTFDDKFDTAAIELFVKTASTPLIGEVGPETYAGYMAAGLPLAYIFAETPEERASLADELKPIATKHKGVISFATIDAKAFGQHASNLNLEVGKFPAFAIQETVKNQKFPYDQSKKITAKSIGKFVDDFVAGKIEPSIKSEPIPEKQEGPVTVIVAHNYKDVVLENDKDVLVEYYAPWCGHCKALAPKYEELASLFNGLSSKVIIAKVDATANDVPEEIQGFPTIKLFPANSKDAPVDYSGSRTVEDMAAFIRDNGSHKVDAYANKEELRRDEDMETDLAHQAPAATKKAEEVAQDVKESAKSGASAVKDTATGGASAATDSVKSGASAGKDSAKSVASDAQETVQSGASAAKSGASAAKDTVESGASKATDSIKSAASAATDGVKSGASKATDSVKSGASAVKDSVKSVASDAQDTVKSGASAVKDSTESVASGAQDTVKGGASAVKDSAKSAASGAQETVEGGASAAKDTVKSAASSVQGSAKVSDGKDTVKSGASKASDSVNSGASKATDSVKSGASKATDSVKSAASKATDSAKSGASKAAEAAKTVVGDGADHDEL